MKRPPRINRLWFTVLMCACILGCEEDDSIISDNDGVNSWVYSQMAQNYLWSASLPQFAETDTGLKPKSYFEQAIRYRDNNSVALQSDCLGDRFSYIEFIGKSGSNSGEIVTQIEDEKHGFGFKHATITDLFGGVYYYQVLYVVPGSPADESGLRRGDCFLWNSGEESEIGILDIIYPETKKITIVKADYHDDPVVFHGILQTSGGPLGYLMYTHFTAGTGDRNFSKLKDIFAGFKSSGVKDVILDLRYNGGGELRAARQLCSLLAPYRLLGQVMIYKERNVSMDNPGAFEAEKFLTLSQIPNKPDTGKLYIITSGSTASASELIIHALRGYLGATELEVVGATTRGKNLGGFTIAHKRYEWELHPITLRIYDHKRVSGYEEGLAPDHISNETTNAGWAAGGRYRILGQLGDAENEVMLKDVMALVNGDSFQQGYASPAGTSLPIVNDNIVELPLSEGYYVVE